MDEEKSEIYLSPERLELVWLLLRKRNVDSYPQQVDPREGEKRPLSGDSGDQFPEFLDSSPCLGE